MSERESEEILEHVTFRSTIPIAMKAFFCLLLLLVLGVSASALETTTPKIRYSLLIQHGIVAIKSKGSKLR